MKIKKDQGEHPMKKRVVVISSAIIVPLMVIVLLIAGNYFYDQSVNRGVHVELHTEPEAVSALANQQNDLLDEAREWYETHKQEAIEWEQTSYDGLELKATFFKNEQSDGKAVILAHGYKGNHEHMSDLVKFYFDQGFDILMPDARGHGDSEGNYIGYGWHDRKDYQEWIKQLIEKNNSDRVFLHGNSMGAALVLMTSGEELPEAVKGIVADSGYTSVKEELSYQLKHLYHLPAFPLMDITSLITKVKAGYTFEEASAVEQVKENTKPLFIIHGAEDELVPTEMANTLYEHASGEKKLWIVPKAGHTKAYAVATEEFQNKLSNFLDNALEE